ncbi:arylesterase [Thiohalobacter sp.]|uniref:arylesterase n=1 Tax=Thiohalobacter sp. TaxID=2025948 RepID=UPI0026091DEC|nr:arylesterase [Thiohalobacter sp.]
MRALCIWVLLLGTLPVPASARTLLVLGDSLSAAYGLPEAAGWVALLAGRLPGDRVVNASVSGETTAGGLARLPALLEQWRPDWVLLELGGNDGLRGLPPAHTRNNLARMIELSRAAGAKVLLIGIRLPPNYGQAYVQAFERIYPELAESHEVPLVPFLLEGVATRPELMQPDGIHPRAEAQPLMLENVWQILAPRLGVAGEAAASDAGG